jgi:hypothetical protein
MHLILVTYGDRLAQDECLRAVLDLEIGSLASWRLSLETWPLLALESHVLVFLTGHFKDISDQLGSASQVKVVQFVLNHSDFDV